ncbi:hypothetical protein APB26_32065 [Pseudomonas aeruginosa]|nr:hypothetical protein APB26_32065 [Pseudomonas aeruginosa]RPV61490.1 ASCH domain-containing protein [Pseudomonas aeruginosa]
MPHRTALDVLPQPAWKALSIRQPWASMIIHLGKDCENRTWKTRFRGRLLIHASQNRSRQEWLSAIHFARLIGVSLEMLDQWCCFDALPRGGIIGAVDLVDAVDHCDSPWYMGEKGLLLRNPQALPFIAMPGRLGLFDVSAEVVKGLAA